MLKVNNTEYKIMKRIIYLLAGFILMAACTIDPLYESDSPKQETDSDESLTRVKFHISNAGRTRSSIAPDEAGIQDINIYAYRDGMLEAHAYALSPTVVTMELTKGYNYNLYALANTGEMTLPVKESEVPQAAVRISDIEDLAEVLPMAWKKTGVSVDSAPRTVSITLERLVSRIGFSLDASLVSGLQITSVRLCQSASAVRPFATSGSMVMSEDETIDGDYASGIDLDSLNGGESVFFYALENCQGSLLPDNTDPWAKVPDALGEKAALCTYIEAVGEFQEGFLFEGTVTYRIYLGEDNTSDFSIIRNNNMAVTLTLTGEGLNEISWKVDPDVELQPGFAYGYLEDGMHTMDDLYVGERFIYSAVVADDLVTHLGGDLSRCSLALVSEDGGAIDFDNYEVGEGNDDMMLRGTCTSEGSGSIWLCGPDGVPATMIEEGILIQKPRMIQSFYASVDPGDNDFAVDEAPCCVINGADEHLHIYLADRDGYNLNSGHRTGFDLSLFTFEDDPYKESDYGIEDNITITLQPGIEESDGPAATYILSCRNDGGDPEANGNLCYALRTPYAFTFDIDELNHHISGSASSGLDFQKITLTMVDNGWADYHDCQLSLKVKNPSNLPLVINGWQVNRTNTSWNAVHRNSIIDEVENEMTLDNVAYITNAYYQDYLPLYGQGFTIHSERNGGGDQYIVDGEEMVYPLSNISTDDMLMAMSYLKCGQESLYHLVDVSLPTGRLYSSEVDLIDNLEDGSMTYSIIYGDDPENPGYDNQGMWLYSNGSLIRRQNTTLNDYYNVTAKHLTEFFRRYDSTGAFNLVFTYDDAAGHLYARCEEGNLYNIKIDSEITGSVRGNVTTYPNGTWGSSKDNPCTATISGGVGGVSVGTTNVSIDGGAIKAGMNAIYNQTFFDSKNWIGSANNYQHRAHPTQVTVKIRLNVSSSSAAGLYPFTILWRVTTLPFYHAQDGKTYNPGFTKTIPCYTFVRVTRN